MTFDGSTIPKITAMTFNGADACTEESSGTTTQASTTSQASTTTSKAPTTSTEAPTTTTKPSASGSCSSIITNSWTDTVQGTLKITVPTDITSFTIQITTDVSLTNLRFYTANYSPTTGTSFTLTQMSWFAGLVAGQVLELGYEMSYQGPTAPSITSVTLNGQDACSGSPVQTTTTAQQSTITEASTTTGAAQTT